MLLLLLVVCCTADIIHIIIVVLIIIDDWSFIAKTKTPKAPIIHRFPGNFETDLQKAQFLMLLLVMIIPRPQIDKHVEQSLKRNGDGQHDKGKIRHLFRRLCELKNPREGGENPRKEKGSHVIEPLCCDLSAIFAVLFLFPLPFGIAAAAVARGGYQVFVQAFFGAQHCAVDEEHAAGRDEKASPQRSV